MQANTEKDFQLMKMMKEQDYSPVATNHSYPRITILVGPTPFSMMRGWEFFLTAPYEGATYISTVLHNAGFPVKIVDVRFEQNPLRSAFEQISNQTDVLGICTFEDNFPFVRNIIDMVKENDPNIQIICGGSLITSIPDLFFENTKLDIGVISEGELTILDLMLNYTKNAWEHKLDNINGIIYRKKDGKICRTKPRGQMPDLNSLPRMRLDLWPQAKSKLGIQPQVISSYSRGCMMDCAFCFRTTPQVRLKSMEKFDEDLKWLKEKYNVNFTFFTDLTFSGYVDQTLEVCDVIKQNELRWTCMCRCVDADKVRLDAMREAGCDIILFGVESMGSQALKEVNKPTTKNINIRAMNRTFEASIRFGALMIIGLPGETEDELNAMVSWAETFKHVCRVKYLSALPGTKVYFDGLKQGFIRSEIDHINWLSIEQGLYEDEFLNVNRMPEKIMRNAYERIYNCYQPGPVVDFNHFPEHFKYFYPNLDDGSEKNKKYAGSGWRKEFSSAGVYPIQGSEKYTLDKVGASGMADIGASLATCNAKSLKN